MLAEDQDSPVYRHFVPGEFFIVFEVSDPNASQQIDTILAATRSFLSQQVNQMGSLLEPLRRKIDDEYRRKRLSDEQRTSALEVVEKTERAEAEIRQSLDAALDNLQEGNVVLVEDRAHVFIRVHEGPLVDEDDERILPCFTGALELQARQEVMTGAYTVIGASLNWLMASSQGNLTTGGPGALPVPPSNPYDITQADWEIVEVPGQAVAKGKLPAAADVYILDTVPPYGQLEAALGKWGSANDLIKSLLDSLQPVAGTQKPASNGLNPQYYRYAGKVLTLHYYEKEDEDRVFTPPLDYAVDDHHYPMPDHGLFIAGIIHAQAECAQLHMIQVLNDYGVGTLGSLLWGLRKVRLAIEAEDRAVLNCSLTYAADLDLFESDERPIGQFLAVLHIVLEETGGNRAIQWETKEIEHLYRSFPRDAVVILAAAGNDSEPNTMPVPAKNPAAFASVLGVGALDSEGNRAPYSNYADKPPTDGFLTFGGDADQVKANADTGILGVYTYEGFPDENTPANEAGWARWAGTSFATAVVAGAYAERFCAGRSVKAAHKDLKKARYQGKEDQPFHLKRGQRRRNEASNQR